VVPHLRLVLAKMEENRGINMGESEMRWKL
jgi:hypothetical protein